MISVELLRSILLFQGLEPETEDMIRHFVTIKEYARKEVIFHSDTPGTALFMLCSGRLQIISTNEEGKQVGINFVEPGDIFGEVALIDGGGRSATVVALDKSVVGFMPRERALWLFNHNPIVAARVQRKLCAIIRQEVKYRSNLGSAKAFHRIYSVMFHTVPPPERDKITIENLPSQQAIAAMANVSRETVSRALHALIKNGIVLKDGKKIVIKNPKLLSELTKGEASPENK